MKPILISHELYQDSVLLRLRRYYSGGIFVVVNKDWPLVAKFWRTDLSYITTLLQDYYDAKGPEPRDPSSMLRSYLLFLMTKPEIGLTEWVNEMRRIPYYAILSGFEPGNLPGVGTFYDFFKRLWAASGNNLKPKKLMKRKRKPKKGKKGEKAPTTTPGKVQRLVEWMIRHADKKSNLPSDRLFNFFQTQILTVSANLGLLGDMNTLTVAGDGTPIVTSVYSRSKSFKQRFTLGTVDKMLLDAAHDAEAIYHLLDHQNTEPFIDLNCRSKKNSNTSGDIHISLKGVPICPIGLEMKSNGHEQLRHRNKWRCPLSCGTRCSCTTPCSNAKYGRTYYTNQLRNLRLFTKTSRNSEKWTLIYNRRSSVERSNKREKIDYKLESGRHRSTKMWYVRIYGIMMCQHLDAWYSLQKESFEGLKSLILPQAS
ncbi:hypothetical protein [Desulfosporosinus fructosivorans]